MDRWNIREEEAPIDQELTKLNNELASSLKEAQIEYTLFYLMFSASQNSERIRELIVDLHDRREEEAEATEKKLCFLYSETVELAFMPQPKFKKRRITSEADSDIISLKSRSPVIPAQLTGQTAGYGTLAQGAVSPGALLEIEDAGMGWEFLIWAWAAPLGPVSVSKGKRDFKEMFCVSSSSILERHRQDKERGILMSLLFSSQTFSSALAQNRLS